jgi:hypothetical protein
VTPERTFSSELAQLFFWKRSVDMFKARTLSIVSKEDRKLLHQMQRLIGELLETLDVLSSPDEMKALEEASKEIKLRRGKGFQTVHVGQ